VKKQHTWALSLIVVLCIALFPGTSLAAVTVNPVSSEVHPGSPITISGTSDLTEVMIRIHRPDQSILYFNVAKVVNGSYSDKITLGQNEGIGAYQIQVGQGEQISTTAVTVTTASVTTPTTPSPVGGGGGAPLPSTAFTANLDGASGGEVASDYANIKFPSNVFKGNFKVVIDQVKDVAGLLTKPKSIIVGDVISITKDVAGNFNSPITITMDVKVVDIDIEKYEYAIYWFNETTKEWVVLDNIQFNPATGRISGEVNHFTKFAVLAHEKEGATEEPVVSKKVLKDIQGHWAEKHIQQLVDLGAITGYPDGLFLPNNTITRAEFVQVLVNAFTLEQQGAQVFEDTKGHWAQESISKAMANGIVTGYDAKHFGPNDPITREQIASMIMRAAQLAPGTDNSSFTDHAVISKWAQGSVAALVKEGILTGYADGSLKPQKAATRAEAATMILLSIQ
jgi:hypothetical protein